MSYNPTETIKEKMPETIETSKVDTLKTSPFILLTQLAKIEKTDKPIELPKPEYTYYTFKSQRHTNFAIEHLPNPEESVPLKDKARKAIASTQKSKDMIKLE
jgi:hypothetical protein